MITSGGTVEIAAGETKAITGIAARADCLVWEPDSDGLLSDAADREHAKTATIPVDGSTDVPADVTVTNTVPVIQTGAD